jgi:BCD family chlorophyll transporter-like MFS transporter
VSAGATLGWVGIVRLGLVQTALGAIVVLTTSTLNRVMVVELALPAMLPGLLVGLHYGLQMLRPRWGFGSDRSRRRSPWILAGMATLAAGGALAAGATALMGGSLVAGIALAVVAVGLIGVGVGAAGTSLLVLLAERVAPHRRAPAATIVWTMMIAGFALTATLAGHFLDPFSPARLVAVATAVSGLAFALAAIALWGLEDRLAPRPAPPAAAAAEPFAATLASVWREPQARLFTVFIFVSMLAYSAQDLVLEPFAGTVFAMTPGESTRLGGLQNGGVLAGMILVALLGSTRLGRSEAMLRSLVVAGCLGSAAALAALASAGTAAAGFPLRPVVFALGFSNGVFAVAAIGAMMALAGGDGSGRQGTRMGLWGAAQAVAFGIGGFLGTVTVDLARHLTGLPEVAYSAVFAAEAVLFVASAALAARAVAAAASRDDHAVTGPPRPLAHGFEGR